MLTEQELLGALIKRYRLAKNITMEELGKTVGIGKSAILKYEKGNIKDIPIDKLLLIQKTLRIPFEEFPNSYQTAFRDTADALSPMATVNPSANTTGNETLSSSDFTSSQWLLIKTYAKGILDAASNIQFQPYPYQPDINVKEIAQITHKDNGKWELSSPLLTKPLEVKP